MRRALLMIALSVAWPVALNADYSPYSFFELAGGAELIVSGEVQSLRDQTYLLKIDRVLAGDHPDRTVEIRKFVDWPCAWRDGPYTIGERLLCFLVKADLGLVEARSPIYSTMGSDTASERPIKDGIVHLFNIRIPQSMRAAVTRHDWRPRFPIPDVASAIADYRTLYRVQLRKALDERSSRGHLLHAHQITRLMPQDHAEGAFRSRTATPDLHMRLQTYARKSLLHRHLVDTTEQAAAFLDVPSIGWKSELTGDAPWPTVIHFRTAFQERPK